MSPKSTTKSAADQLAVTDEGAFAARYAMPRRSANRFAADHSLKMTGQSQWRAFDWADSAVLMVDFPAGDRFKARRPSWQNRQLACDRGCK
jgi:hypothetical protein